MKRQEFVEWLYVLAFLIPPLVVSTVATCLLARIYFVSEGRALVVYGICALIATSAWLIGLMGWTRLVHRRAQGTADEQIAREKKLRRFRFTIRDLLFVNIIAALALGWFLDWRRNRETERQLNNIYQGSALLRVVDASSMQPLVATVQVLYQAGPRGWPKGVSVEPQPRGGGWQVAWVAIEPIEVYVSADGYEPRRVILDKAAGLQNVQLHRTPPAG